MMLSKNTNHLNDIKTIYSDFYKTNYVWPISSAAMAAYLAFKYLNTLEIGKTVVVPINASELMYNAASDAGFEISFCKINLHDFGLNPVELNEMSASIVYAKDSYGIASSYCAGTQGRFVIEDMLDSPFTPHTGTGNIFYTSVPGNKNVAIIMTRDPEIAGFLDSQINKLGLNLSTEYAIIVHKELEKRHDFLLNRLSAAHTLLKMLPASIQVPSLLCNYFSYIPLILPKEAKTFVINSNTGNYLYNVFLIPSLENVLVLELLDTNLNILAGIANRIMNYLETS